MKKHHILRWGFFFFLAVIFLTQLKLGEYDYKWNRDVIIKYIGDHKYDLISKNEIKNSAMQFLNNIDSTSKDIKKLVF